MIVESPPAFACTPLSIRQLGRICKVADTRLTNFEYECKNYSDSFETEKRSQAPSTRNSAEHQDSVCAHSNQMFDRKN